MSLFSRIRLFFRPPNPDTLVRASLDDKEFTLITPDGTVHNMPREAIRQIAIETTDTGPFLEDEYWAISDGERRLLVPQASPDFGKLLEHFKAFPQFDYEAVIRAMGCTDNREFVCWKK